jgi:hypothetical protein
MVTVVMMTTIMMARLELMDVECGSDGNGLGTKADPVSTKGSGGGGGTMGPGSISANGQHKRLIRPKYSANLAKPSKLGS